MRTHLLSTTGRGCGFATASLYCAGADLDRFSEEAIRAANPSYDHFQNKSELLAMAAAARRLPSREADYRRFTLNQRIQVATPFVSPALWDSCKGQVAPLAELPVLYAGLDLSAVSDLSAFVMVGQKGGKWHSHCRFWLPEVDPPREGGDRPRSVRRVAASGHLHVTPGKTIDYDFVAHALHELFRQHNIQKVAYDPWNWHFFKPALLRAGFTESTIAEGFQEFAQTTKMMSPALANLERLLLDGRFAHDNPVLSMCVANTTTGWPALARTLAKVFSSPSPVDPKRRNGLLIAALQLAPVMNLRDMPVPPCDSPDSWSPKANSTT